ncbi:MAG: hypothetical protein NTV07_02480 [Candidatus Omnitrophica bacterium]|nr:hypothetical protein [Candidatus Omnitrophota bacterium]
MIRKQFSCIILGLVVIFAVVPLSAAMRGFPEIAVDEFVPQPVPHEGNRMSRDYYDFRLYKGYNFLESALINKQQVPSDIYIVRLRADMFDDGQVYTWSLKQVYDNGNKSQRSFQSFKVKK